MLYFILNNDSRQEEYIKEEAHSSPQHQCKNPNILLTKKKQAAL